MGYVVPQSPNPSREAAAWPAPVAGIVTALVLAVVILLIVMNAYNRAGTVITYVCQPGDTAVVRDGFGQKTPQCVSADGATIYWPERIRVPR